MRGEVHILVYSPIDTFQWGSTHSAVASGHPVFAWVGLGSWWHDHQKEPDQVSDSEHWDNTLPSGKSSNADEPRILRHQKGSCGYRWIEAREFLKMMKAGIWCLVSLAISNLCLYLVWPWLRPQLAPNNSKQSTKSIRQTARYIGD